MANSEGKIQRQPILMALSLNYSNKKLMEVIENKKVEEPLLEVWMENTMIGYSVT